MFGVSTCEAMDTLEDIDGPMASAGRAHRLGSDRAGPRLYRYLLGCCQHSSSTTTTSCSSTRSRTSFSCSR